MNTLFEISNSLLPTLKPHCHFCCKNVILIKLCERVEIETKLKYTLQKWKDFSRFWSKILFKVAGINKLLSTY